MAFGDRRRILPRALAIVLPVGAVMPRQLTTCSESLERALDISPRGITFAVAADSYIKHGGDSRFLPLILEHLGNLPLKEITQSLIDQTAALACPKVKISTKVRQFYVPVAAVVHHAAQMNLCLDQKIQRPRLQNDLQIRWISPATSMHLADACAPHFRPLYLFMQHTGARPPEALFIDWRQIDLQRGEVCFASTNGTDERVLKLGSPVLTALKSLPYRAGPVFRRPDRQPYKHSPRAASAVKTAFTAACRRAAIAHFTLRDVRVTWCMWVLALSRDLTALMRNGGWADERVLTRFKRASEADLDMLRAELVEQGWVAHFDLPGDDDE
jgi:integrase